MHAIKLIIRGCKILFFFILLLAKRDRKNVGWQYHEHPVYHLFDLYRKVKLSFSRVQLKKENKIIT